MKNINKPISRRRFLKSGGRALASLFTVPLFNSLLLTNRSSNSYNFPDAAESLGRVTSGSIILYDKPSEDAQYLKTLNRDTVLPITQYVLGESKSSYNKIWYEMDGQGFAHSGFIQPVQNNLNQAITSVPTNGRLCEVTIPYTDGVLNPSWPDSVVYRLYYGTVFWINRVVTGPGDRKWYRILDEEGYLFYADASHLKVLEYSDIAPISPEIPNEHKRLEVNLQEQTVVAYEKNVPVFMTRAATGAIFYTGNFSTPQGSFTTHRKRPSRHMMDPAGSSYDLPGVPWVCYVNDNGVAFHGTYWHNDFGAPRSHGCINLSNDAAKWIYRWTSPAVPLNQNYLEAVEGTRVDIW